MIGPELIQLTSEKVLVIRERIKIAQDRQKSYADNRRKDLSFEEGDHVFLKVSPTRGTIRFGKRGKLSPRFIGPFEILKKIGAVAYQLALPPALEGVHPVFHVSMLRRYVHDPAHVISYEPLQVHKDLTFKEQPVGIVDRRNQVLRTKSIPLVKVIWRSGSSEEATWELESRMRKNHPHLFGKCLKI